MLMTAGDLPDCRGGSEVASKSDKVARQVEKLIASGGAMIPELIEILSPEVGRVGEARAQTYEVLAVAVDGKPTAAVHSSYASASNAMVELCQSTLLMGENVLRVLVGPRHSDQVTPAGLFEAIDELRGMGLELELLQFFTELLLIELITAFESYIRACETFLDRPIGSHEVRRRAAAVGKTLLWALPGTLAKGAVAQIAVFAEPIWEAGKQLLTSPLVEDKERVRAEVDGAVRLDRFKSDTKRLLEELPHTEANVATTALAIATKLDAAHACLELLRPLFEPPPET